MDIDWYDQSNTYGFVVVEVSEQGVDIDFINSEARSFEHIRVDGKEGKI